MTEQVCSSLVQPPGSPGLPFRPEVPKFPCGIVGT